MIKNGLQSCPNLLDGQNSGSTTCPAKASFNKRFFVGLHGNDSVCIVLFISRSCIILLCAFISHYLYIWASILHTTGFKMQKFDNSYIRFSISDNRKFQIWLCPLLISHVQQLLLQIVYSIIYMFWSWLLWNNSVSKLNVRVQHCCRVWRLSFWLAIVFHAIFQHSWSSYQSRWCKSLGNGREYDFSE